MPPNKPVLPTKPAVLLTEPLRSVASLVTRYNVTSAGFAADRPSVRAQH